MDTSCKISDALNTYNTALKVMRSKGYTIVLYPDEREEYLGDFWAIKGTRCFTGKDPLRVLGLIAMWEQTGDVWQAYQPDKPLYDAIISRALPDSIDDFNRMSAVDFEALVADYRVFFNDVLGIVLPETPSKQYMFELIDSYYIEPNTTLNK